jgi:uncharacterized membrane protein YphA (DoxX/SURF4 family)
MKTKLLTLKIISRVALGIVWFYEGLVPKVLFLRADEIALVQKSHLVWGTPELTLRLMCIAQIALGIWLIIGVAERIAVVLATLWMSILIALVASGNRSMLADPYGALVKDFCLMACAFTVWLLSPITKDQAPRPICMLLPRSTIAPSGCPKAHHFRISIKHDYSPGRYPSHSTMNHKGARS